MFAHKGNINIIKTKASPKRYAGTCAKFLINFVYVPARTFNLHDQKSNFDWSDRISCS